MSTFACIDGVKVEHRVFPPFQCTANNPDERALILSLHARNTRSNIIIRETSGKVMEHIDEIVSMTAISMTGSTREQI